MLPKEYLGFDKTWNSLPFFLWYPVVDFLGGRVVVWFGGFWCWVFGVFFVRQSNST